MRGSWTPVDSRGWPSGELWNRGLTDRIARDTLTKPARRQERGAVGIVGLGLLSKAWGAGARGGPHRPRTGSRPTTAPALACQGGNRPISRARIGFNRLPPVLILAPPPC